jgi:GNAT superfamily N-acetyltransferase
MAHHVPGGESGDEWAGRTWQQNRDDLAARVRAGTTTGTLAYVDGKLAGWCNASPRAAYPGDAKGPDDDRIGFVACFVISPPYRRHGLARQLLAGAVDRLTRDGMTSVQAHPGTDPQNAASSYRGTVPLFEQAGFTVVDLGERITAVEKVL